MHANEERAAHKQSCRNSKWADFRAALISPGPPAPAIPPQTITHPNLQFQKQEVLLFGLEDIHQLENVGMLHPKNESHKVEENNANVWFIYCEEPSTVIAWYYQAGLVCTKFYHRIRF